MSRIHLGISTCPNDTFAFHAILEKKVDLKGLEFSVELLDIEQLNTKLFAGTFDVAKCSFHAALKLASDIVVLSSGSALGFGVGPLLLAASENPSLPFDTALPFDPALVSDAPVKASKAEVLCPGENTTATLLWRLFHAGKAREKHVVFSEIMPALVQAKLRPDANRMVGVCIHEGRFTYREHGLHLVEDLGQRWEQSTGCPLPLGGIVARKSLPRDQLTRVQAVIKASIEYGLDHRDETISTMKRYAQEFDIATLFQHVDLYVNRWTIDLGAEGRQALDAMSQRYQLLSERTEQQAPQNLEIF